MFVLNQRRISIMVLFAVMLHLFWATILLVDDSALGSTALHALGRVFRSPIVLVGVIYGVAICAAVGLIMRPPWFAIMLMPQQMFLMISAYGALDAIYLGQFSDGSFYPRSLIAAGQAYSVIAAICHTAAIIMHVRRGQEP